MAINSNNNSLFSGPLHFDSTRSVEKVNEKPNKELNFNPDFLIFAPAGKFVANKHHKIEITMAEFLKNNKL